MSTRLLVLGAVRIMSPVHGYQVRRELLSWRLDELANVKPGSIYNALRQLEKDGCLAVHDRDATANRPERTTYMITAEGRKEFEVLLRQAWWNVQTTAEPLVPALCLMLFMPREELVAALAARAKALQSRLAETAFTAETIRDGATGADGEIPEHVREILAFMTVRTRAELEWTKGFRRRLLDGAYTFAEEMPGGFQFQE